MKVSVYRKRKVDQLKEQAVKLYKQGLSTRQVGEVVKRSHNWVAIVVREKINDKAFA